MMKILIVGQYFWPENFRINEVADTLSQADCTITVLTGPPNYPEGRVFPGYSSMRMRTERRGSVLIHRVPLVLRGSGSFFRLIANYLSFVVSASILGPWMLRRQAFDVILVYAPGPLLQAIPAIWLGSIKRAKVVTWVQDLWPESLEVTQVVRNRILLKAIVHCIRWIYRHNDLLLVQSRSFVEPVRNLAGRTQVIYHPNPGELPVGETAGQDPRLRLNRGFNVVFAGNLGTVQALDTILAAAENMRDHFDVWWVVVGSGSRGQWMANEVQRRGLKQVVLAGRFPPDLMQPILSQASALLVSLVRSPIMSKTVPSKIQAYLAAGRPIIAALDGEGARVVTEAGAGLACPAEDAEALGAAVLELKSLTDDELDRMGQAGRRYYQEHYDPQVLGARMLDCLQHVVAGTLIEPLR